MYMTTEMSGVNIGNNYAFRTNTLHCPQWPGIPHPGHVTFSKCEYTTTLDMRLYHRADISHPLSRNSYHRVGIPYPCRRTVTEDGYSTSWTCNFIKVRVYHNTRHATLSQGWYTTTLIKKLLSQGWYTISLQTYRKRGRVYHIPGHVTYQITSISHLWTRSLITLQIHHIPGHSML
jgi:hypothetical protein